jgi:hypothetical protein
MRDIFSGTENLGADTGGADNGIGVRDIIG